MGFGGNNWGDPNSMAWLGMAQALGQAAMPSRMPVPNGAVFGALAGGLMQGAKSGYDMKKEQMQTQLYEAQAGEAKRKAEMIPKFIQWLEGVEKGFGNPGEGTAATPAQYAPSDTTDPGIVPSPGGAAGDLWGRVKTAEGGLGSGGESLVSPKGAIGVSQILPSTAREMAAKLKLPFDEARLHTDQKYNEGLGKEYLSTLLTRYDGNEVLAAAAYNAGPGRVDDWVKTIGDPRTGNITDAAFISQIPIAETRNYVGKIAASSPRADLRSAGNQWLSQNAPFPTLANGVKAGAWNGTDFDPGNLIAQLSGPGAGGAPVGPDLAAIPPPRSGINAPVAITQLASGAVPGLPTLSSRFVFGTPTAPTNAGRINPGAVPSYGVPQPGQARSAIPPGYKPPSPLAGAAFGQAAADGGLMRGGAIPGTPLASGAVPAAPLSLVPGVPAMPMGAPDQARSGPFLSQQAMALAKIGSAAQLLGFGDIAKPWETAYYGSPAYKAEVEAAATRARETAGLPFVGPKESAKHSAAEPFKSREALLKADLDARNTAAQKALELANADLLAGRMPGPGGVMVQRPGQSEVDAAKKGAEAKAEADARASVTPQSIIVTLPDGSQVERQVTQKQYAEMVAGNAPAVPGQGLVPGGAAPGTSYGKPVGMGGIPDGYRLIIPPEGGPARLERVPGSPGAQAAEQQEGAKQQAADVVSQEIANGLKLSNAWTTGIGGAILKGVPGSAAHDLQSSLDTIKANVGFDRLQVMRNGSATGGALGPVSDVENRLLQSTLGSLEQSQSREQFEKNLRRLHEVYQDVIHGAPADLQKAVKEGKLSKVQYDGVMERRKTAREAVDLKPITADIKADVDGAIARGAPREAVIQRLRDRGYDASKF